MPLLGAEHLGQFDGLVDDDAIGNLRMHRQLVDAETQRRAFHRVDLLDVPVEQRLQVAVERIDIRGHTGQQVAEIGDIEAGGILVGEKLVDDLAEIVTRHLPLVECLQGVPACLVAFFRHGLRAGAAG